MKTSDRTWFIASGQHVGRVILTVADAAGERDFPFTLPEAERLRADLYRAMQAAGYDPIKDVT